MSRSNGRQSDVPENYWIGQNVAVVPMQRQSKYSDDCLSLVLPVAEIEDGDSHYNKFDLDEPENH